MSKVSFQKVSFSKLKKISKINIDIKFIKKWKMEDLTQTLPKVRLSNTHSSSKLNRKIVLLILEAKKQNNTKYDKQLDQNLLYYCPK